jgi:hypothetical protein
VAVDDTSSTDEDTAVVIDVVANDTDVDNANAQLTAVSVTGATGGTATLQADNRSVRFVPAPDANSDNTPGGFSFTYRANDGSLSSAGVGTVRITVIPVNDAPVAVDDGAETLEDTTVDVDVVANDTDVDNANSQLTAVSVTGATGGTATLQPDGRTVAFSPDLNANSDNTPGGFSFTYRVNDGELDSANVATVTITVIPVNDAPVAVDDHSDTLEDTPVGVDVVANDTDVDNANSQLTAVSVTGATGGTATLQPDGRTVVFAPDLNANDLNTAGFSFTYRVNDGELDSANTATVTIAVTAVNDAPTVDAIAAQRIRWGNGLTFAALAHDVDIPADTLTYSLVDAPAGAGVNPSTGVVTWTPTSDQVGDVTFTVRVDDGGDPNLSAETSVTVTVEKRPTRLVYSGGAAAQFSDPTTTRATLTDDGGEALQGQAVGSRTVTFAVGSQTAPATTDGAGLAQATIVLNQPAASPGVTSTFAGDGLYLPSSDSDPFTITPENATLAWTGPRVVVAVNADINLSATVAEAPDGSLGNRLDATQLRFTVRRNSNNAVVATCTAAVGPTGAGTAAGRCPVHLGVGTYTVTVELIGNGYYAAPPVQSPTILVLSIL